MLLSIFQKIKINFTSPITDIRIEIIERIKIKQLFIVHIKGSFLLNNLIIMHLNILNYINKFMIK